MNNKEAIDFFQSSLVEYLKEEYENSGKISDTSEDTYVKGRLSRIAFQLVGATNKSIIQSVPGNMY